MSRALIELKDYQRQTLDALTAWLNETVQSGDANTSFYRLTRRAYQPVAELPGVPYACLRVPTGGGKTLIAAHAIGQAADAFIRADAVCAVWLCPSSAILDQTIAALKQVNHPYRMALAERFGANVRPMTVAEALYAGPADYDGGAAIIVATIQSFRQEETNTLNVYKDNGALMDHFSGLDPAARARLEPGPSGQPVHSLANALKLRRPMVIVDEAHNARTDLSFITLARLDPSLIVELTATPAADSNVLHHVSAAELKTAEMIKLPIILRASADWKETLRLAKAELEELTEAARAAGERLRPVMLIQAQANRGPVPITPDVVKAALLADFAVTEPEIKIATGSTWELDNVVLGDWNEPARFIITVQALREGWDCPSAYVLCSLAVQNSSTAVEQMLGRIMRLPGAKRKPDERLNRAYAFAATTSFADAARALAEGLVANGFERIEAQSLIRPPAPLPGVFTPAATQSAAVAGDSDLTPVSRMIADVTGGRVRLDPHTRRFSAPILSAADAATLRLSIPARLNEELSVFIHQFDAQPEPGPLTPARPFAVPLLAVRRGEQLEIFDQSHFLDVPWALERCDAGAIVDRFVAPIGDDREAVIDVRDTGKIGYGFVERLHDELALSVDERDWPYPKLVRWLDQRLAPVKGADVTQGSAQAFIKAGLNALIEQGGQSLPDLRRYRFRLVAVFARLIQDLREQRATDAFETALFGNNLAFDHAPTLATTFDADSYIPRKPYRPRVELPKHIRPDLFEDMNDEEERCATAIDIHNRVARWVRNVDRLPTSFRLRVSNQWFYPDFVAELSDGGALVVEYKGAGTEGPKDRTEEKDAVGRKWASVTGNRFVMARSRDYDAVARALS